MTQAFNGNLPKVSYMKVRVPKTNEYFRLVRFLWNPQQAIDVWMLMCNFFVFASMIEYAFAQLLIRMKECIANAIIQSSTKYFVLIFTWLVCNEMKGSWMGSIKRRIKSDRNGLKSKRNVLGGVNPNSTYLSWAPTGCQVEWVKIAQYSDRLCYFHSFKLTSKSCSMNFYNFGSVKILKHKFQPKINSCFSYFEKNTEKP